MQNIRPPEVTQLGKPLRVGELAKRTGKTVRALHLYEELSLLKPVHRSKGGFRLYSPSAVERVTWISKLQEAGFSLHQLQEFLGSVEGTDIASLAMNRVREVFAQKLRETREQVEKLQHLEQDLEASLAYLEACKTCQPPYAPHECGSCNHNGHHDGEQPLLVAGIHRG
jgi:MerR family transcriptional regulator, copper efflux regulator